MVSNLDHVRAEEKLPDSVACATQERCVSGALVVDRCFDGKGLQALRAGPAVKDDLGGHCEEQDGGSENSHAD